MRVPQWKARRELAPRHFLALRLGVRRIERPTGDRLEKQLGLETERLGEGDGLRQRLDQLDQPGVEDELERASPARLRADADRLLPDRLEERLADVERALRAGGEDDQLALFGRLLRPGDGRVDEGHSGLLGELRCLLGRGGADGAHLHPDRVAAHGFESSVRAAHRRFDGVPVGEHREDDVGAFGRSGRRVRNLRAVACERLRLLARAIPDGDVEARAEKVSGDGRAHDPRPQHRDFHQARTPPRGARAAGRGRRRRRTAARAP